MRRAALLVLFGSVVTAMVVASHAPAPPRASTAPQNVAREPSDAPAGGAPVAPPRDARTPRPVWLRPLPPALRYGGPASEAFDEAIGPWQAGNYGGAAVRLDALARQHPKDEALEFYRGVAWLLARVPREAIPPLRRVAARDGGAYRIEASWYLGLALLERGERPAALDHFAAACQAGARKGCRALAWLRGDRHP